MALGADLLGAPGDPCEVVPEDRAEGVAQVVALGHVGEGQRGPTEVAQRGEVLARGLGLQGVRPTTGDRGAVDHDEGGAGRVGELAQLPLLLPDGAAWPQPGGTRGCHVDDPVGGLDAAQGADATRPFPRMVLVVEHEHAVAIAGETHDPGAGQDALAGVAGTEQHGVLLGIEPVEQQVGWRGMGDVP